MAKYNVYNGSFVCQTCKKEVTSARFYGQTSEATWIYTEKHLSSVFLYRKKNKKDYEREERK